MPRLPQSLATLQPRPSGKLVVKNEVRGSAKEKLSGICVFEMQQIFLCFKNHSFNEEACASEIKNFQKCYNSHKKKHEQQLSSDKKSRAEEITSLLRRFPERRKGDDSKK